MVGFICILSYSMYLISWQYTALCVLTAVLQSEIIVLQFINCNLSLINYLSNLMCAEGDNALELLTTTNLLG